MDDFDTDELDAGNELWDSDLHSAELFLAESDIAEWNAPFLSAKPIVVLNDRLMTDAALGAAPIKSEHSYSRTTNLRPESPTCGKRIEDGDEDYFPAISMTTATCHVKEESGCDSPHSTISTIKDEPLSCPASPESCPMSPDSSDSSYILPTKRKASQKVCGLSVLKQPRLSFSDHDRTVVPKINIKLEPGTGGTHGFSLPPTPPSSTTSDNESMTCEPSEVRRNARLYLTSSSRQPIHTPLISSQPKGSTGVLMLTEEEKRTLMAEGYSVPTRLPLTKQEEKSLKKIRRKIKNKISAQESRRKKKEYMDTLERKVEALETENAQYRKRVDLLEADNYALLNQTRKLQQDLRRLDTSYLSYQTARSAVK